MKIEDGAGSIDPGPWIVSGLLDGTDFQAFLYTL